MLCLPSRGCTPSSCVCDEELGEWACTRDCGPSFECQRPTDDQEICGTRGAAECDEESFCSFLPNTSCGAVDLGGICTELITADQCPGVRAPVCGCDGVTYPSPCFAQANQASVDHEGPCDDVCPADTDGDSICDLQDPYCNRDDIPLSCRRLEPECPRGTVPEVINGCYTDECVTWEACGQAPSDCPGEDPSITCEDTGCEGELTCQLVEGACTPSSCFCNEMGAWLCTADCRPAFACLPPAGDVCGGRNGSECGADEYCNYTLDAICGAADASGQCSLVEDPRFCPRLLAPVCGCDGETYSNECFAAASGISIASLGACESLCAEDSDLDGACDDEDRICNLDQVQLSCRRLPPTCLRGEVPELVDGCYTDECVTWEECRDRLVEPVDPSGICGGFVGATCDRGFFCHYPPEAMCGAGDMQGVCLPHDDDMLCLAISDPICGCDGMTYPNECDALRNGVSVLSFGECER